MKLVSSICLFFLAATTSAGRFGPPLAFAAKVGEKIPSVNLHSGFPPEMVNVADYVKGRSVIIVGLPGAFTPTWSSTQVPGYLENQDALKAAGVDEVLMYCVNDGAVMKAWAEDQGIEDSIVTFMGDPAGELTRELDMFITHPGPPSVGLLGRTKRFALHAVDGVIKMINISEKPDDPAGDDFPESSCAPAMLEALKAGKDEL